MDLKYAPKLMPADPALAAFTKSAAPQRAQPAPPPTQPAQATLMPSRSTKVCAEMPQGS